MKTIPTRHIALVLLTALTACQSAEEKAAKREAKRAEQEQLQQARAAEIMAAIPADSPLAKLRLGMTEAEVAAMLGVPTSQGSHITGRAFNPFNFGGKDTQRLVYYYQGIGRVEFSHGSWGQRNGVIDIQADATEPGAKQPKK